MMWGRGGNNRRRSKIATIWTWCFFSFPFMLFLCEEASQVLSFGRYILISGGLFEDAREAIHFDRKFNQFNLYLAYGSFPGNPLSSFIFVRYFKAEGEKLRREELRACSELGLVVPVPPPPVRVSRLSVRLLTLCFAIIILVLFIPRRRRRRVPKMKKEKYTFPTDAELCNSLEKIGFTDDEIQDFFSHYVTHGRR